MSDGNKFQRTDAVTGNVRRPTLLLAGMVARTVGLTMLTEVGDVWAGRRHTASYTSAICITSLTTKLDTFN